MRNQRGVVVLAVVMLCLFFTAAGFFVGHVSKIHLDRQDQGEPK